MFQSNRAACVVFGLSVAFSASAQTSKTIIDLQSQLTVLELEAKLAEKQAAIAKAKQQSGTSPSGGPAIPVALPVALAMESRRPSVPKASPSDDFALHAVYGVGDSLRAEFSYRGAQYVGGRGDLRAGWTIDSVSASAVRFRRVAAVVDKSDPKFGLVVDVPVKLVGTSAAIPSIPAAGTSARSMSAPGPIPTAMPTALTPAGAATYAMPGAPGITSQAQLGAPAPQPVVR